MQPTTTTSTTVPSGTTTTTVPEECRPGHGHGDKNHHHTGPPGHNKGHGDNQDCDDQGENGNGQGGNGGHGDSWNARLVSAVTSSPQGAVGAGVLFALLGAGLFGISVLVVRRRRHV
jgi:hypothetical protein